MSTNRNDAGRLGRSARPPSRDRTAATSAVGAIWRFPKAAQTFCSAWCVEEWRLRSDPGYIREKVLERDRGVCAGCGVDCLDAERQLKRLRGAARLKAFLEWGAPAPKVSLGRRSHYSRGGRRRGMRPAEHPNLVSEVPSRCHRPTPAAPRLSRDRTRQLLPQQRLQIPHNRLRHNFVALRRGMYTVLLHQVGMNRNVRQQKRNPRQLVLRRQIHDKSAETA